MTDKSKILTTFILPLYFVTKGGKLEQIHVSVLGLAHLNMSPSPFNMPFLAFPLSLSFPPPSCLFFSFPVFSLSFFFSSLLRPVPLVSGLSEPDSGVWSAMVDTESLPERELSSVSSSTGRGREKISALASHSVPGDD